MVIIYEIVIVFTCFLVFFNVPRHWSIYSPLALEDYQVRFWTNCKWLARMNGRIWQERHSQLTCHGPSEANCATNPRSSPIGSSLRQQSERFTRYEPPFIRIRLFMIICNMSYNLLPYLISKIYEKSLILIKMLAWWSKEFKTTQYVMDSTYGSEIIILECLLTSFEASVIYSKQ